MKNDYLDKLMTIITNVKKTHRDILIEKILNEDQLKTENEKFIEEVRDHLSTCINRSEFINDKYFINKDLFIIEKECNCHTHYESGDNFDKNIQTIYLTYKDKGDFMIEDILTEEYLSLIVKKRPMICIDCGNLEDNCECDD